MSERIWNNIRPGNFQKTCDRRFEEYAQWDHQALEHFRDIMEEAAHEATQREHQIFNRAGALLSLNGVTLALIATFGIGSGYSSEIVTSLSVGVILILLSCIIIAWTIVPNFRLTISMDSGERNYRQYRSDPDKLFALITAERITNTEALCYMVSKASTWMGHGICLLVLGLSFISASLVISLLGVSTFVYIVFTALSLVAVIVVERRNLVMMYDQEELDGDHSEEGLNRGGHDPPLFSDTTFYYTAGRLPHGIHMDTKQILGVIGIAVILIAVGFAIGLSVGDDGGKDGGDGGEKPSETDRTIEYRLVLRESPDHYSFTVEFYGDVAGSLEMYLGDEPLLDGLGEPITRSWGAGEWVSFSYGPDYPEGTDFAYIEDNIRVVFPSYIDAVQL